MIVEGGGEETPKARPRWEWNEHIFWMRLGWLTMCVVLAVGAVEAGYILYYAPVSRYLLGVAVVVCGSVLTLGLRKVGR